MVNKELHEERINKPNLIGGIIFIILGISAFIILNLPFKNLVGIGLILIGIKMLSSTNLNHSMTE